MNRFAVALVALIAAVLVSAPAAAQTCPTFQQGLVLTPAQWQACFDGKQNTLGYIPVNKAGDTMAGRLVMSIPGTTAGLNLTQNAAPSAPVNGDIWITSSGLFARVNGSTVGPYTSAGGGTVNSGTAGQMAYYATSTNAVSGNANVNISSGAMTLGVAGSVVGSTKYANATSGTIEVKPPTGALGTSVLTLPVATDTLVGKATTDTFTNKTYDTAGSGNSFKINGTAITSISGNTAKVGTTTGTLTNGNCVSIDASGNFIDAGGPCTTGGGGGTVNAGTAGQFAYYATSTNAVSGNANFRISGSDVTVGVAGSAVGTLSFANATSGTIKLSPTTGALGSAVLTLPAATDTLIGKATTDTLTNKTFDTAGTGNSFSINGVAATANTGTGAIARAAGPTFTTPTLGVASATTINKVTITAPATGSTLTIIDGKTHAVNNSITLAGTDSTTWTGPSVNATLAALNIEGQTLTGGANVTSKSLSTGTITVDAGARPLQYITNNGAWTINAPANDGSAILLITNGASASTPTITGFSVGSNTGDALTNTNGSKFMMSIVRINGSSTYSFKALQ